jgi:predicted RND superfamily exporter protein
MFSLGLIMVIGILCCLLACLILLPAILVAFGLASTHADDIEINEA